MREASHTEARKLFQGHLENPRGKGDSPGRLGLKRLEPRALSCGHARSRGQARAAPTHFVGDWASGVQKKVLENEDFLQQAPRCSGEGNTLRFHGCSTWTRTAFTRDAEVL